MSKQGYVYFISNGDSVKIGFTSQRKGKTPEQSIDIRMKQLQVGNSNKLKLLYYLEGTMDVEKSIQSFLKLYKKNGEWFDNSNGAITDYIKRKKLELRVLKEEGLIK